MAGSTLARRPAMTSPMNLWLVRHPRVVLPEPTCYGASEVPLDTAHVRQCAQELAQWLPEGCVLLTSERERTQALAHALRVLRPDLPAPRVDARLNEMDFGCWELTAWRDIPQAALQAWTDDFARHRFGGRESAREMLERVADLKAESLKQYKEQHQHLQLWITHGGVLKALRFLRSHTPAMLESAAQWPQDATDFGQVVSARELGLG